MVSGFIIGNIFGFLLQRVQFCFVSGIKSISFLTSLMLAICIQSIGIFTLSYFDIISIPNTDLPLIATLVGGFCFGFGMIIASVCVCGAWFRSGEGFLGAFVTLIIFSLTITSAHKGVLKWKMAWLENLHILNISNFYTYFKISPYILISILFIVSLLMIKIFQTHISKKTLIGGFLIGILGIVAWYFSSQHGRDFGFGISIPTANIIEYITTGQKRYLNWGSIFVLGIFTGSFLSAFFSKTFHLNSPQPLEMLKKIFGGFFMGIGAYLGGGCTITNTLVATAYFSAQAWIWTIVMMISAYATSMFFKSTSCKI